MKKIIYMCFFILLFVTTTSYGNEENKELSINECINIKTKKIKEEEEFFKSNIKYPQINIKDNCKENNKINNDYIEDINKNISNYVNDFHDKIKYEAKKYETKYKEEILNSKNDSIKYQYEIFSNYKVSYNKNNVISIPITTYEFSGGAHGMTYLKSFNYDLLNNKEVILKDLFKEDVDYKGIINDFIKKEMKKNPQLYFKENGFEGISDNQGFYLDNNDLVIYFKIYEIAPYYVSIPKFKINFDDIDEYMKKM